MEEMITDSGYFRERILEMRQRLHAMDGFSPVEKISENLPEREEIETVAFIKNNEKVNS